MLTATHLSKSFGPLKALDDVSVHFEAGSSVALIGPNGSGKTTFIKSLLGLVRPDSGELTLGGCDLLKNAETRSRIGYMPQISRFPDHIRISQLFGMLTDIRQSPVTDTELVETFGLNRIGHKRLRTLSGGTRQKVSACLAFMFDPEVLILDEPTAGLDPYSSELLKAKVAREKSGGKLVIITSHILSDLDDLAGEVMYLLEGKMIFFKPVEQLKVETGETKLGRAIARIMQPQV